jgi:hypothetical protein
MSRRRPLAVLVALALVSASLSLVGASPAAAADSTLVIDRSKVSFPGDGFVAPGWIAFNDIDSAQPDVSFVSGPPTPPAGVGSARFHPTTGVGSGAPRAAMEQLDAARSLMNFSHITNLAYSSYRETPDPGGNLAVTLQFVVDYDVTDATNTFQGRITFEPYFTVGSGNVLEDTWQTWSPMAGKWWASSSSPKVGNVTVSQVCGQATPCTWTNFKAQYPKAGFLQGEPGILLRTGGWAGDFTGYADKLVVGIDGDNTTWDLEPSCSTDCYVSPTGNDTATGNPGDPVLTIQKGVDKVSPGGTVHVANGTYAAGAVINKALTLDGESQANTIIDGPSSGTGLAVGAVSNVSITHLTVKHFNYGITTFNGPISNFLVQHVSAVSNVTHGIWSQAFGVSGYTVDHVDASNNGGVSGRGLWMINGVKQDVTVTNSTFTGNSLVGIDISDGTVSGLDISGNTVTGNGDSGIGVLGAIGSGANLVASNIVTNNGRYGIEVKNSTGSALDSGPGSVTVRNNTVSRSVAATDARDYGGIVVIRRFPAAPAPDQPAGIVIEGNSVSGYHRKPAGSTGDGFGIVVGGTSHVITKNTVSNNDVGIQVQAGNTADTQSTIFFDRDNAAAGNAAVTRNAITGNGTGLRTAGTVTVVPTCNWWGSATGPSGPGGVGSGDGISSGLTYIPWLQSSDLDGSCPWGAQPTVSTAASASTVELNSGSHVVGVPVTLSNAYAYPVSVAFATADGVGPAAAQVAAFDYAPTSGTLTFAPGETSKTVPVTVYGGSLDEPDETFQLTISNPTNATLGSPTTALITIVNDDTPTISVPSVQIDTQEGNSGTHPVYVTVTLSNGSLAPVTVNYAATAGSAVSPGDFKPLAGTLTFAPGEWSKTVAVLVKGDTALEDYEYLSVVISNPGGGASAVPNLGNAAQLIQILNDEKPALTGTAPTGAEGTTIVMGATLVQRYYLPITIGYTTGNGTAVAPGDYTTTAGTLMFSAGTKGTQTVGVPTNFDFTQELGEKFTMSYTSGSIKVSPLVKTATIKGNKT